MLHNTVFEVKKCESVLFKRAYWVFNSAKHPSLVQQHKYSAILFVMDIRSDHWCLVANNTDHFKLGHFIKVTNLSVFFNFWILRLSMLSMHYQYCLLVPQCMPTKLCNGKENSNLNKF